VLVDGLRHGEPIRWETTEDRGSVGSLLTLLQFPWTHEAVVRILHMAMYFMGTALCPSFPPLPCPDLHFHLASSASPATSLRANSKLHFSWSHFGGDGSLFFSSHARLDDNRSSVRLMLPCYSPITYYFLWI
jgi:hypothetical protein